jgi:GR25 family glycosyltransferase involved in LPS biosynthesis
MFFNQEYKVIKKSKLFDDKYYLKNYPDVRRADVDPLKHYVTYGWKEGRNPSEKFDTNFYLATYSDIALSKMNPLLHYIKYGQAEGRWASKSVQSIDFKEAFLKHRMRTVKKIVYLIQNDPTFVFSIFSILINKGANETVRFIQEKMHIEFIIKHHILYTPEVYLDHDLYSNITIITPFHTLFVAHLLYKTLTSHGFKVQIETAAPKNFSDNLHIVICPQIFDKMPSRYIAFQMEQSVNPRWFTPRYFEILKNSLAIFDYSIQNIEYLQQNKFSYKQLFFLPLSPFQGYQQFLIEQKYWDGCKSEPCDVLFYGDPNNDRRKAYLQALQKRFSVKVVSEVFGNELYRELTSAKIIVNIHYYENALLETTRMYECLSLGLKIVSEESSNMQEHQTLIGHVEFTHIGDIEDMVERVEKILALNEQESSQEKLSDQFAFYLNRALLSMDFVDFDTLNPQNTLTQIKSNETKMFCLGLPENIERRKSFNQDNTYNFTVFDGLRHTQGWIGCGLSYKYLITLAKASNLDYVIICEDDVEFPSDFNEKLFSILDYLEKTEKKWDMFSGLIADVHEDTKILDIESYNGNEFIYIDKMTSMVFNIYHHSFYDKLINWDDKNHDLHSNTIDRYIESQGDLIVVTTLPFLVGHKEEQTSSIWHFQNTQYNSLFEKSNQLFKNKVDFFKDQNINSGTIK